MSTREQMESPRPEGWFATTHWSVVLQAQNRDCAESAAALENLCRAYWQPLYIFARRQGHNPTDAEDLVQEFFARLLQKGYLQAADPARGRFRTFLIMAFKRFLANEWDRARAQKRGGDRPPLPLDTGLAERCYQTDTAPAMAADSAYDRHWALTLLGQTMSRLQQEHASEDKAAEFAVLKQFLVADQSSYAEAAERLGRNESAVRMAVHRLRKRYREIFREEISRTLADPAELETEIRHLLAVLAA